MQPILITVLMPVYNAEKFVSAAISSILQQSVQDFEFLIIDDGSTDQSATLIQTFQDPRICYLRQENQGIAASLNRGLQLAKGKYIARMDADDIADPHRLEKQVQFLETHRDHILVCSNMRVIDSAGKIVNPQFFFAEHHSPPLAWLLLWETPIAHPTVMLRTEILRHNQLTYSDRPAEDSALWRELIFFGKMARLGEVLLSYRIHPTSLSQQKAGLLLQDSFTQAIDYARKLGLEGLENLLAVDISLAPYPVFYQFAHKSIMHCAKLWSFTESEQKQCELYIPLLYFNAAVRLGLYPQALSCLFRKTSLAIRFSFLQRFWRKLLKEWK